MVSLAHRHSKKIDLPTELTLGQGTNDQRTYEIIPFVKKGEGCIGSLEMGRRTIQSNLALGQEDRQYILKHQKDIPHTLRWNIYFLFLGENHPDDTNLIAFVLWDGREWICLWVQFDNLWNNIVCGLRLRKRHPAAR